MSSHVMETPLVTASELVESALKALKSKGESQENVLKSLEMAIHLLRSLDPYLDKISSPGSKVLQALIEETNNHDYNTPYKQGKLSFAVSAKWSAGAYEGMFLSNIARQIKAKRVLEIGMFTGTSTLCIAEALPNDGKIVTLELDEYLRDLARPYFEQAGVASKIDVRIGKAMDSIKAMIKEEPFDMIFIDADKGAYQSYYDAILQSKLLRKGGLMLVDNTLYKASPFMPSLRQATKEQLITQIQFDNGEALAKFNDNVSKDDRVIVTVLPIRDGVSWIHLKE